MRTVLIVDDDSSFLASLADGFSKEDYRVVLAADGAEALQILDSRPVDLVVTDVKMPRVDGLQLVGNLISRGGLIPCILMTAFGTPGLEQRTALLGGLGLINKPIDLAALRQMVRDGLSRASDSSLVRGITLSSFFQLLAMERKTCTVIVSSGGQTGLVFLRAGVLADASVGGMSGLDAACEVLSWNGVEIAIRDGCPDSVGDLRAEIASVLLEAMQRIDEAARGPISPASTRGAEHIELAAPASRKECTMSIDTHLDEFKGIHGYLASGIMDFTGEALAAHSASPSVDLVAFGAVFNDIFRAAHEASIKIGLQTCRTMAITTPKGLVIMECSGVESKAHLHFIVVLEEGGNQALTRMTMSKLVPKVVAAMA